jgi:iron complex outermembrane receptor protein
MKKGSGLLTSAGALVLATWATPVIAQSNDAADPAQSSTSTPATSDPVPAAQAGDDIVVTALRTSTLASKTPVALTAISGAGLRDAGITDASALDDVVPNLSIDRFGVGGIQITIRGVSSNDATEKGDPSAAFLQDGIYLARPQAQDVAFFDIDRVEVLRGPQGTLYGRNTTAGVVSLISATPKHEFQASADASYGNYNAVNATAMLNVPLGDVVAVRGAVNYDRRDNYVLRGAGGAPLDPYRNVISGRLSTLFDFGDDLRITLRGDYSHMGGRMDSQVGLDSFFTGPFVPGVDPLYIPRPAKEHQTLTYPDRPSNRDDETWGVMGEVALGSGPVQLTYLGSYRELTRDERSSNFRAAVANVFTGSYWQNSQELRLAYNQGAIHTQVGGYYFKEKSAIALFLLNPQPLGFPPTATQYGFPQDPTIAESWAGFGQATLDLADNLHLTGGIRYSHDLKSRLGLTVLDFQDGTRNILQNNDARRNFSKTTWKAGIDYDVPDLGLVYASVSTGYKAGGFNDGCEIGNGPTCALPANGLYYSPETLTAYEGGFKFRLARSFSLNAAVFHYDYSGLQLSQVANLCGGPCTITTNAAKAKIDGIELESVLTPSPRLRVDLSLNLLNARYGEFTPAPGFDWEGVKLNRAPRVTVSAGSAYTQPLGNGASLVFDGRIRLSDEYFIADLTQPFQFRQPSFHKTDVSVTFNAPDGRWYLQGFGRNLENTVTLSAAATDLGGTAAFADPRTYGVRAGFHF